MCIRDSYNVPVLIHAFYKATGQYPNESTGRNVARVAARYPELKIIMAHLGGNCYDGLPAIRSFPNVWVDYSGSIFRADELPYALEMVGANRILHGSDMPGAYLVCLLYTSMPGKTCRVAQTLIQRRKHLPGFLIAVKLGKTTYLL